MKYLNKIKSVRSISGYRIRAVFADGFIGEVDLKPLMDEAKGPLLDPLRDAEFFQRVYVDGGAVSWPNGYDICPDVLRYYCEIGRVCSSEELNAAFTEAAPESEPAAATLNDKPKS